CASSTTSRTCGTFRRARTAPSAHDGEAPPMRVTLITASNRQPSWVAEGFDEYARRLRAPVSLELKEIPLGRRTASAPPSAALAREGERMLAALPREAHVVALDERGDEWSTVEL